MHKIRNCAAKTTTQGTATDLLLFNTYNLPSRSFIKSTLLIAYSLLIITAFIMQLSAIVILLASSTSAFIVTNCRDNLCNNWSNNHCHDHDVGTSLKHQSDKEYTITLYSQEGCRGVAYSSDPKKKCLGLPNHLGIKSVKCQE
ncbi:hypothetical protein BDV96DRAFT_608253 [Lophiotrema nucula]|uniref:Uncharacterized protein n=1 Tax=Lophiotrema nucula TaxID=690887 RepID=A0A6A5YFD6_9PLEO|nr:hypothetical protein BDV96DRAFT_608253 [Lophiotrema nucula]